MALPTTVVAITDCPGYHPPFISSGGNVYVIQRGAGASTTIRVYKATDPTSSFTRQDSANEPTALADTPACLSVTQNSDTLHIAYMGASEVRYADFDMSSDSWGSHDEQVVDLTGMTTPGSNILWCSIAFRAGVTSDELVIAACGIPDSDMGSNYEAVDFWHKNDTATSWTGPVSIAAGSSTNGSYGNPQLVQVDGSSVDVWFGNAGQAQGSLTALHFARCATIRSANTVSTIQTYGSSAGVASLPVCNPVAFSSSGTDYGLCVMTMASNNTYILRATRSSGDLGSISNVDTSGTDVYDGGASSLDSLLNFNGENYLVFSGGGTNGADKDIYINIDTGGIGDAFAATATELLDAVTCNHISANVYTRSGSPVIAYIYDDGGTLKYNEYSLSSTTDAAFSMAATATLTGSGESNAASALSSSTTASLTWAEASSATVEADFTFTGAGALTAAGAATAESDLAATATALLTAEGVVINVTAAAWDSTAAAAVTWDTASTASTDWTAAAAAAVTWNAISTAESDWTSAAAAVVAFNGETTDEAALTATAVATLTGEGASTATADKSQAAAASVTWTGEATAVSAAALDSTAAAALTATGESTSTTGWSGAAAAAVTFNGESTGETALTSTAVFTFNGATSSDAAAAYSQMGTAAVTWRGEALVVTEADLSAAAAASVTWTGEALSVTQAAFNSAGTAAVTWSAASTAGSDLSAAAVALVTFNGESTTETALSAAAVASWTADGASTAATAKSLVAAGAVAWNGETALSGAWSATATAAVTFAGQPFLSADASIIAAAATTMVSSATAEADITAAGAATLAFVGIEVSAQTAADLAASAVATFTALGGTVVATALTSQATAALTMVGLDATATTLEDFGGQRNLRKARQRRKRLEEIEEEDIMLLTAALFTYMGQTNGN